MKLNTHYLNFLNNFFKSLKFRHGFFISFSFLFFQCQVPMFVATKLAKIKAASLFVASPSAYARAAVAAIGYEVSQFMVYYVSLYDIMICVL